MTGGLLAETPDAAVYHCDHAALAEVVAARGGCDALIFDAPYSAKTHSGHRDGADAPNEADQPDIRGNKKRYELGLRAVRRDLNYGAWDEFAIRDFVNAWRLVNRGWWVSLTDNLLAPLWTGYLEAAGLYVFSPLACVEPGGRVRLTGDGPAQWSCWAVVARPRAEPYSKWGSLPGAYVVPPGQGGLGRMDRVVGGKPLWLMSRLVEDYSRPGDLICDPVAGGFTTGKAAVSCGRKFIGGDAMEEHAQLGADWARAAKQRSLFTQLSNRAVQNQQAETEEGEQE